jgi:hypothetical protein
VSGVTDPTGLLRRAVTAHLKSISVCIELRRAFTLDEDTELAADMWSVLRSCTWDISVLKMLGSLRPLAPYMAMITKLVDGDSFRVLLHHGALSRICRRVCRENIKVVKDLVRRIEIATSGRVADVCLKLIQCNPPFTLTRGLLSRYDEFLGVDVCNAAFPDPFEMIVQPTHAEDAIMVATFKEVVTCGKDSVIGSYAWNSPGTS